MQPCELVTAPREGHSLTGDKQQRHRPKEIGRKSAKREDWILPEFANLASISWLVSPVVRGAVSIEDGWPNTMALVSGASSRSFDGAGAPDKRAYCAQTVVNYQPRLIQYEPQVSTTNHWSQSPEPAQVGCRSLWNAGSGGNN